MDLTKTLFDSIDAFHRGQLRYAIGIVYALVIPNANLYEITKVEPLSKTTETHNYNKRNTQLIHTYKLHYIHLNYNVYI